MLKQNIQELTYELDKVRDNDVNSSIMSASSFQQTMIQELELKIQSLQSQNDTLRNCNEEKLNAKYIEIENKLFVAERDNQSLKAQIEQEKQKTKKIQADFIEMESIIKQGQSDKQTISENSVQAMMLKN